MCLCEHACRQEANRAQASKAARGGVAAAAEAAPAKKAPTNRFLALDESDKSGESEDGSEASSSTESDKYITASCLNHGWVTQMGRCREDEAPAVPSAEPAVRSAEDMAKEMSSCRAKLAQLEAQKREAVAAEEYAQAAELKRLVDECKAHMHAHTHAHTCTPRTPPAPRTPRMPARRSAETHAHTRPHAHMHMHMCTRAQKREAALVAEQDALRTAVGSVCLSEFLCTYVFMPTHAPMYAVCILPEKWWYEEGSGRGCSTRRRWPQ